MPTYWKRLLGDALDASGEWRDPDERGGARGDETGERTEEEDDWRLKERLGEPRVDVGGEGTCTVPSCVGAAASDSTLAECATWVRDDWRPTARSGRRVRAGPMTTSGAAAGGDGVRATGRTSGATSAAGMAGRGDGVRAAGRSAMGGGGDGLRTGGT